MSLTLSNIMSMAMKFFASLFTAVLLGPTNYGFWSIVELINRFSPLFTLGISSGVKRELPYWNANNYEFGLNEDSIYNRWMDLVDNTGSAVSAGGALKFFELSFVADAVNLIRFRCRGESGRPRRGATPRTPAPWCLRRRPGPRRG